MKIEKRRLILNEDFFFLVLIQASQTNFLSAPPNLLGWYAYVCQGLRLFRYDVPMLDLSDLWFFVFFSILDQGFHWKVFRNKEIVMWNEFSNRLPIMLLSV